MRDWRWLFGNKIPISEELQQPPGRRRKSPEQEKPPDAVPRKRVSDPTGVGVRAWESSSWCSFGLQVCDLMRDRAGQAVHATLLLLCSCQHHVTGQYLGPNANFRGRLRFDLL